MNIELYNADFLNFVELNYTGDNDEYRRCDSESKYLDTGVFNLFLQCFENANKLFDYFSGTKYNSRKIIVLRNELIKNLEDLKKVNSLKDFTRFIEKRFMGKEFIQELKNQKHDWNEHWQYYYQKLINLNEELIRFTEKCADEEKILWVIGY